MGIYVRFNRYTSIVDRYLYIMKPLRYAHIVTHGRAFLAVSGIWITASCIFIVLNIHVSSYGIEFRSFCDILDILIYGEAQDGGNEGRLVRIKHACVCVDFVDLR